MTIAVPDSLITGYEALVDTLVLPDPDDRHVLAAAIHAGAKLIVTSNLVDFPPENLARYHLKATHPDAFIHALIDSAPDTVLAVVIRQAADLQNPPRTIHDVLDMLQAVGLGMSVARLRELIAG